MEFLQFEVPAPSRRQERLRSALFWWGLGKGRVFYYVPVVWLNGHKAFEWMQLCAVCEWRLTWPPGRCVCRHCLKG